MFLVFSQCAVTGAAFALSRMRARLNIVVNVLTVFVQRFGLSGFVFTVFRYESDVAPLSKVKASPVLERPWLEKINLQPSSHGQGGSVRQGQWTTFL